MEILPSLMLIVIYLALNSFSFVSSLPYDYVYKTGTGVTTADLPSPLVAPSNEFLVPWISEPPNAAFDDSDDANFPYHSHLELYYSEMLEYNKNATKFVNDVKEVLKSYKSKLNSSYIKLYSTNFDDAFHNTNWQGTLAHSFAFSESKVRHSLFSFSTDVQSVLIHLDFVRGLTWDIRINEMRKYFFKKHLHDAEALIVELSYDISQIRTNLMKHLDNYGEIEKNLFTLSETRMSSDEESKQGETTWVTTTSGPLRTSIPFEPVPYYPAPPFYYVRTSN